MGIMDEMMEGVTPPAPPEKSTFRKIVEYVKDNPVHLETPNEDFISSMPNGEIATALTNYGTGAIQGAQEQYRQEQNIRSIANVDEYGNASPKEGYSQEQVDAQKELTTKAQSDFAEETIKPPLLPAAMAGTAMSKTVSGILFSPFMIKDLLHSYNKEGGGLEGTKQVGRDLTYGGAVDFVNQPDLQEQFQNKPITTTVNGILSIAPPFLIGKGIFDASKAKMSSSAKPPTIAEEMGVKPIEKPVESEPAILENIEGETVIPTADEIISKNVPAPNKSVGNDIVEVGNKYIGEQMGSNTCAIYTRKVLNDFGVDLGTDLADGQYLKLEKEGKILDSTQEPQKGDIVFWDEPANRNQYAYSDDPAAVNSTSEAYKGITHVGIYAGEGKAIQSGSHGVATVNLGDCGKVVGFGRAVEGEGKAEGVINGKLTAEEIVKDNTEVVDETVKQNDSSIPAEMDAIEKILRENVNEVVEPASVPVGGSVKIVRNTPGEFAPKVEFSDSAIESRWQEASKGIQKENVISSLKESLNNLWNKASRVYENLPNTAEFAPLKYDLLKLEKQKSVASDRTVRIMQGITAGFDKSAMDLFTRKVVLDDLAQTKGDLPFGLTTEIVNKSKEMVDSTVKTTPVIEKAIEMRKKVWEALKTDYSKTMKDIGFNVENKLGREDYFRHQVLEYANAKAIAGSGQKLKTPTNRGFLREREGSIKDINANYLQAEFEVMSQMMHDTELAKTINRVDKSYSIRTKLFDEFGNDWRDNIPEGYTTWQPREGSSFHMANSIPEKLATQVLGGVLKEVGVSADQITQVLAKGSPFKELVIKQEIADTLNKIAETPSESVIGKISRNLVTPWKVWTLMSPTRAIKYNLRNITGDADALFTMNPTAFKRVPQATSELYQTVYGDRAMTPEMGEWFRRGGMETTLAVQELQDVSGLRMFEKFSDKSPNVIKKAWEGYWGTVKTATQFREAIFRYATYLDYLKQMQENGGKPKNFGASIPEEVMALPDIRDRAFDLSNKVLGAYDNVGVLGKDIRTHVIPFWSWYETNFKRYAQFFDNQKVDSTLATAISKKLVGNVLVRSPYYAYATGSFVVKAGMMWGALQVYNNLIFPDEEKELPIDEQSRPHIILGRDTEGKVRYFSRLGALPDFLEWFGLDTPVRDVKDYLDGSRSMQEIVKDMGKSPINKLGQGISPLMKIPAELATGKKLFPDVFNPRSIKDNPQYIADSFGLGNEFKAITKTDAARELGIAPRPSKPYFNTDTGENLLNYKAEPNQSSYYSIQDRKRDYLKEIGKGGDGDFSSPKTEILRNYKIAIRLKDAESAGYYLTEYKKLGGTKDGLQKSLKSMDPLAGLNDQERIKFKKSLNGEQQKELEKSTVYYKTVLMGK